MEIWDVYDENRVLTGRTHVRGRDMKIGDYHLVVVIWIQNKEGKFLCSRRAEVKMPYPGYWENSGGAALTGEDSLTAALREIREELGVTLDPANGKLYKSIINANKNYICDVWHFRQEVSIDSVVFQEEETCDARWLGEGEIRAMMESGEFLPLMDYFNDFLEDIRNGGH